VAYEGFVADGWSAVAEAFAHNIESREDIGAGVAVFHKGECVVDIAGGYFDKEATQPYTRDTLQLVFSTTKGVVATAVAICVERGLLAYEQPVSLYWPEFAAHGKEHVTVAQLLSHQAGLYTVEGDLTYEQVLDWDTMVARLADTPPLFPVGSTHGYHAITFGWLAGELVRRVDGRSIGQFIAEEISGPLGGEIYVGLPQHHEPRVSPVNVGWPRNSNDPPPTPPAVMPNAHLARALTLNGALNVKGGFNRADMHAAQVPGANGIANARSLAAMYSATFTETQSPSGVVRLLNDNTRNKMTVQQTKDGEVDLCLQTQRTFAMGFATPSEKLAFDAPGSYGHAGAGGSVSFADPGRQMGFSYIMNRMKDSMFTDPRAVRLIEAASRCADADANL
jgi:CubicO group peptidase (beta-lactamase class C family)